MIKNGSVIASLSDQLRRDISLGILQPGEKLNIEALKRGYSVSHPSVREALSLLVGEGYVSFEELKGFRVLQASQEQLKDSSRVRAEMEALAFEWSVELTNVDWRSSMVAAHYALSELEQQILEDPLNAALEWDNRNKNFHMTIVGNSGSQKLIELVSVQYDQTRRYRLMAHANDRSETSRSRWVEKSAEEHNALKDAVLQGDIKAGQSILRSHITKATLHVIEGTELQMEGLKGHS
ncbi:GntR family transcriptional regulator [uncultured Tateyamaria sp.]|uniref:GntR family transcriptional regulator n=1 Tax=uncultured Tateyamaria sp. TaxID=455651 RepID=UPI00261FF979|nr:GntR family transcriptional regulator [uncultured Tateyamaria sp.]